MPYTRDHKRKSRERILDSAGRLFSRRGYDSVSIDDLMQDAGLTRGAFYNHFQDKADVYAQAIVHAALKSPLAQMKTDAAVSRAHLLALLDSYLSRAHVDHADLPCPLSFLVTDVGVREPKVRATYTRMYRNMVDLLRTARRAEESEQQKEAILAVTALMIGGVAISRALNSPATADRLLKSCRSAARQLLRDQRSRSRKTRATD